MLSSILFNANFVPVLTGNFFQFSFIFRLLSFMFLLFYVFFSSLSLQIDYEHEPHTFPQWATVKYVTVAKVDGYQTIYARKLRIIGNSFWWLAFWCTRLTCAMDMAVWLNHRADHQHFDMDFKHRQIIMIMNYTAVDLRDSKKTEESVENAVMPGVSWIEFDFGWAFFDFELQ